MKTVSEYNRYCACGHQEINHFKGGDCIAIIGEHYCGCQDFVLDSYITWPMVDCLHEISYINRRGVDCETICDNPLKWKVTISKNDTPDALLVDTECENCGYLWNDDSASDYRKMEQYAIDLALNDNPFEDNSTDPDDGDGVRLEKDC